MSGVSGLETVMPIYTRGADRARARDGAPAAKAGRACPRLHARVPGYSVPSDQQPAEIDAHRRRVSAVIEPSARFQITSDAQHGEPQTTGSLPISTDELGIG